MRTICDVTSWLRQYRYFHYSSYWGTWSRVIVPYNHPDGVIELNITPVNPDWEWSWQEQVMPIIFRWHCTSLDRKDEWTDVLPDYVPERMREHLVPSFVDRLLNETWIDRIDIATTKRGRSGGGGIPFAECGKERSAA
jgi:hypothetical protein